MRIIDQVRTRPGHCAIFPHLGQNHAEGYFDTSSVLPGLDPHVVVSVRAVKELATQLGWASPEDQANLAAVAQTTQAELDEANERIDDLEAKLAAIDLIESEGFTARKKRGPKPKEAVA